MATSRTKVELPKGFPKEQSSLILILDLMPTPLILVEPGTARVTFANKAADDMAGGSFPKDKPGEEYDQIYWCYDAHGKRLPNDQMPGVKAARGEKLVDFQMSWDTPQGRRWLLLNSHDVVRQNGLPPLIIITFQDVTQIKKEEEARRLGEEKMQVSETRYRTMFEQSPFSIQVFSPDGLTLQVNKSWENLWGLTYEQVKDYNVLQDHQLIEKGMMTHIRKGFEGAPATIPTVKYEPGATLADADDVPPRWVRAFIYPVKNQDGSIREVVLMHEDITDQVVAEEEKLKAYAETRELEKINVAKDEFIALASHQLRTPATGVKQFLSMALDDGFTESPLPPEHVSLLKTAYASNERQLKIIDDLLRVAGVDAGRVEMVKSDVDLREMIQGILDEYADIFRVRKQGVDFHCRAKSLVANVDESKIRMVLENVIDNASKYTYPGKNIRITCHEAKDKILIAVQDEGVGINKDDVDKLFRKFSRIRNPLSVGVGGTGLGLYWVKKIIDIHAGSITVDSEPEKGTTFTISLPIGRRT